MEVSWKHPNKMRIKNRTQADDTGLALIPKLKYEHLHLTSYSKVRVDYAAQIWNTYWFITCSWTLYSIGS